MIEFQNYLINPKKIVYVERNGSVTIHADSVNYCRGNALITIFFERGKICFNYENGEIRDAAFEELQKKIQESWIPQKNRNLSMISKEIFFSKRADYSANNPLRKIIFNKSSKMTWQNNKPLVLFLRNEKIVPV